MPTVEQFSVACFNVLFNSEVANPHTAPEHMSKFPSFEDMTDHPKRRPYILEMLGTRPEGRERKVKGRRSTMI